jgi:Ran GTPase-activating protein (RanGAP) involved in mRNA processing and transport
VGDHGGLGIAQMLCENSTLLSAELGNMDLGHRTLTMLGEALKRNSTLEVLSIDRPLLFSAQEEAIEHVAMGLRENTGLRALSIKHAGIRERGCYFLCDNLALNHTLNTLDLSSNKLPEDAGPSLAKLLNLSQGLSTLLVSNNQLGDRGCTALADALARNQGITDLDVAYNDIGQEGLIQLAAAIQEQASLVKLCVWGNDLQAESTSQLAFACQQCRNLKECDMLVQIVDDTPNAVLKITPETHSYHAGKV